MKPHRELIDTLSAEIKGRVKDDNSTVPLALVSARRTDRQYNVDEREGLLYIRVNDTHPNFRVVAARLSTPQLREAWRKPQPRPRMRNGSSPRRTNGNRVLRLKPNASPSFDLDDAAKEAFRAAVRPLVERQYAELPPGIAALLR